MHIRGSPFSVVTKLLIQMLGTPMKIIENLSRPWGVAVRNSCCSQLQSGEIVVAENEHQYLLKMERSEYSGQRDLLKVSSISHVVLHLMALATFL